MDIFIKSAAVSGVRLSSYLIANSSPPKQRGEMASRRTKNTRSVQSKEELSREMRRSKLALFIQQFEKEAQERVNEMEAKMENTLATVEKVFKVELMKMPPSLQNTLIGDLISEEEFASEESIASKNECGEVPQPRKQITSKRAKPTDSPDQSAPTHRVSSKTSKGVKETKRTRTLVCSNSTGNLIRPSSVITKRTRRLASCKTNDLSPLSQSRLKLRSVVSAGDLHCSTAGSTAHIAVTTAQGLMVSFSEETKDDINWDMLDDVARCQIKKLSSLIDYLSQRSGCDR
ncbi:borealin-2 isoform X1 [Maylandia zebra]|uniref:borealin-2 isoform X1 n=1 Tax=Maylandia zebra TaxID=106582 RepID=UPI000329A3F8|nr:borealin-2-like isoform X1 [Astatotilapia calliptera]